MPPSPAYNWLCVLATTTNILSHVAQQRAGQIASTLPGPVIRSCIEHRRVDQHEPPQNQEPQLQPRPSASTPTTRLDVQEKSKTDVNERERSEPSHLLPKRNTERVVEPTSTPQPLLERSQAEELSIALERFAEEAVLALRDAPPSQEATEDVMKETVNALPLPTRHLQASKVPSSRIGRLFHYGGLAASLGYGAAAEVLRRTGGEVHPGESIMLNQANIGRLVSKLSQMRGAALKLGQFLSIQDTHVLPPEIDQIFRQVQDAAHYMPDWQLEQVLRSSLGNNYMDNFSSFERIPSASASIGQVHFATLAASVSPTGKEEPVAVKVQFPGVKESVQSDLGYVRALLNVSGILPKGLFLDRSVQVLSEELSDECDYTREASFAKLFGQADRLGNDERFKVPWVWDGSTGHVLVMERMEGVSVGQANADNLSAADRNEIATRIIELCLRELFEFRLMQTDPNWTNFLWNAKTRQVELVDFGATREYSKEFMDSWFGLLNAASRGDREQCVEWSLKLGYLTGEEVEVMVDAHVDSMQLLATPFKPNTVQPYAFGCGTEWSTITQEIRDKIPIMLQHRLTPPPRETYSLNRKLSGAFLLASRLGAVIDTRAIWEKVAGSYDRSV